MSNDVMDQTREIASRVRPTDSPSSQDVAGEIKAIIARIIDVPVDELDCDAHFIDDLGVDSLLALEMLSALERRFKIEVPEEELVQFTSVNKVIEVAQIKLGL